MAEQVTPYAMQIGEAAEYAGVSRDALRRAIKLPGHDSRSLPAKRLGNRLLVMRDDLEAWVARLADA